ncbi:MAG: Gfo/Idh/MocA family oxidoreductase [Armatimonadetes bacterium]|nr:Gfo/Idh/MocA family oxidoreductase [Armatimonadota bacterium]
MQEAAGGRRNVQAEVTAVASYRVGLIGTGRIGSEFEEGFGEKPISIAGAFSALPGCRLVAGCNRGRERLERFGRRWGVTALYQDHRTMLANEGLDIVAVATPPGLHCDQVIAAAEAGAQGIFCEKPMALSLGECDAMIAACEAHGCRLLVNCSRRWSGLFEAVRRDAEAGRWGRLLHLVGYCQGCKPRPEWEAEHEGPMLHDAVHLYDIMRFFGGDVRWVLGTAERRFRHELRVEDTALGLLQFASGAQGVTIVDELTEHSHFRLELHFERGLVSLVSKQFAERAVPDTSDAEPGWWTLGEDTLPSPAWDGTPILNAARDLVHCVRTGATPRCLGTDGRAAMEVIMAFYEFERRGHGKVALPLVEPCSLLDVMREEGRY